jgi:hypothetical protein
MVLFALQLRGPVSTLDSGLCSSAREKKQGENWRVGGGSWQCKVGRLRGARHPGGEGDEEETERRGRSSLKLLESSREKGNRKGKLSSSPSLEAVVVVLSFSLSDDDAS